MALDFASIFAPMLALGLALAGAALIRSGWRIHCQGRHWPAIEGEVTESGVRTSSRKKIMLWRAWIRCRYSIAGRVVECEPDSRVLAWEYAKAGNPRRTAERFKVGTKVILHYDPDNQAVAVLQASVARDVLPFWLLGALFIFGALFLLVHAVG